MSAIALQNLLNYLTATLSINNRKWLAAHLMESTQNTLDTAQQETEYIASSPEMIQIIADGDKQIASGKFETTTVDALWN